MHQARHISLQDMGQLSAADDVQAATLAAWHVPPAVLGTVLSILLWPKGMAALQLDMSICYSYAEPCLCFVYTV